MAIELGGFAENPDVIDGDFNAYNYCLAEDYVNALYMEDFDSIGYISQDLFDNICYWVNYDVSLNNDKLVSDIKEGSLVTINDRTLIDAIYEKKAIYLAEVYLYNKKYYSKLILTVLLYGDKETNIYIQSNNDSEISNILVELYNLIEAEYLLQDDKEKYICYIKNNLYRIKLNKNYKQSSISNEYEWVKKLKLMVN